MILELAVVAQAKTVDTIFAPTRRAMMTVALTIRLPKSLHEEIKLLAEAEGVSINHFLALAAAEKASALRTIDYLRAEANLAQRADFEAFLAAVPNREPEPMDSLTP
jgi:hypothetical protein